MKAERGIVGRVRTQQGMSGRNWGKQGDHTCFRGQVRHLLERACLVVLMPSCVYVGAAYAGAAVFAAERGHRTGPVLLPLAAAAGSESERFPLRRSRPTLPLKTRPHLTPTLPLTDLCLTSA